MADPQSKAAETGDAPTHSTSSNEYRICRADFADPKVIILLKTHHATVTDPSINVAGEQTYALDLSALQAPNIHLWTIWSSNRIDPGPGSDIILGCAALKVLDDSAGEIKSMHTTAVARGRGIGGLMVDKLVEQARELGLQALYLETGSMEGFAAVRRFYKRKGFVECGPFGEYKRQENSIFMRREVD